MTSNRRARGGRALLAFAFAGVMALAACDKGPDKEQVAAELKSSVEAELQKIEGSAAEKVLTHTAVNVTPQDDAYLVAIEGLKLRPSPEGSLEIGTITYLAKPKDEKSYEVWDLKVPQTMPFKGPDGAEKGKLTLTTKAFSGVYSKELSAFQKVDGEFTDISATDDTGGDVRVASAKFSGGMTDKGDGVADSVGNLVLSNLTAKDTGEGVFSVAATRVDGKYDSMKVADYQSAMVKYQELIVKQAALAEQGASGQPASLSPEEQKALTDAIATLAASVKGGDFKVAFKGPKYTKDDYLELLSMLYSVFKLAKSKGMLALEQHIEHRVVERPDHERHRRHSQRMSNREHFPVAEVAAEEEHALALLVGLEHPLVALAVDQRQELLLFHTVDLQQLEQQAAQVEQLRAAVGSSDATIAAQARAGKVRPLANMAEKRDAAFRDVPTVNESGLKGYDVVLWHGLIAPKNLPRPILDRVNGELNKILRNKEMQDRLAGDGVSAAGGTSDQFGIWINGRANNRIKRNKVANFAYGILLYPTVSDPTTLSGTEVAAEPNDVLARPRTAHPCVAPRATHPTKDRKFQRSKVPTVRWRENMVRG